MERLVQGDWGTGLLLEYVFLEVVTVLAARRAPATAIAVSEILLRARELEFVPCSPHFAATMETFRGVAALGLSFVDAAIVTVARARRAAHIATFDTDFTKVADLTIVPG